MEALDYQDRLQTELYWTPLQNGAPAQWTHMDPPKQISCCVFYQLEFLEGTSSVAMTI